MPIHRYGTPFHHRPKTFCIRCFILCHNDDRPPHKFYAIRGLWMRPYTWSIRLHSILCMWLPMSVHHRLLCTIQIRQRWKVLWQPHFVPLPHRKPPMWARLVCRNWHGGGHVTNQLVQCRDKIHSTQHRLYWRQTHTASAYLHTCIKLHEQKKNDFFSVLMIQIGFCLLNKKSEINIIIINYIQWKTSV